LIAENPIHVMLQYRDPDLHISGFATSGSILASQETERVELRLFGRDSAV